MPKLWKKNNYKGISIYGIWIHNFFIEHGKLIIKAPFDDDMVNIVRGNIHEFSTFSLNVCEDRIGIYELEYSLYFGSDEEKKMALDDIITVAEMINIKKEINFPE